MMAAVGAGRLEVVRHLVNQHSHQEMRMIMMIMMMRMIKISSKMPENRVQDSSR